LDFDPTPIARRRVPGWRRDGDDSGATAEGGVQRAVRVVPDQAEVPNSGAWVFVAADHDLPICLEGDAAEGVGLTTDLRDRLAAAAEAGFGRPIRVEPVHHERIQAAACRIARDAGEDDFVIRLDQNLRTAENMEVGDDFAPVAEGGIEGAVRVVAKQLGGAVVGGNHARDDFPVRLHDNRSNPAWGITTSPLLPKVVSTVPFALYRVRKE
jgi:hypothetical protein